VKSQIWVVIRIFIRNSGTRRSVQSQIWDMITMFIPRSGTRRNVKSQIWDIMTIFISGSGTRRSVKSQIWDMKKCSVPDLGHDYNVYSQIWDGANGQKDFPDLDPDHNQKEVPNLAGREETRRGPRSGTNRTIRICPDQGRRRR